MGYEDNLVILAGIFLAISILNIGFSKASSGKKVDFKKILSRTGTRFMRPEEKSLLDLRIAQAGLHITSEWFVGLKTSITLVFILCCIPFVLSKGIWGLLIFVLVPVIYHLPNIWLNQKKQKRQRAIKSALTDFSIYLRACLAGSPDIVYALKIAGNGVQGPLGEEIEQALSEKMTNIDLIDALENMSRRCDVPELYTLVRYISQVYRYGSPLAKAMQDYSDRMRMDRKHDLAEAGGKLSIRLVFPALMLLVLIFIVIGYPVVYSLSEMF